MLCIVYLLYYVNKHQEEKKKNPIRSEGGGRFNPPFKIVAPTHLILGLHIMRWGLFSKKLISPCVTEIFLIGDQGLALRESQLL